MKSRLDFKCMLKYFNMNILIVTAHPSKNSHTQKIADTYKHTKKSKGHIVKVIDLYSTEYQIPFLAFESIREVVPTKEVLEMREMVTWANEIVVVHPIWWSFTPAIIKNWADHIFWTGYAYKYKKDGSVEKLLKGKTAKVFATAGGIGWIYKLPLTPLKTFWKTAIFGFVGIKVVDFKVCDKLNILKEEKLDKHFAKFLEKIKKS